MSSDSEESRKFVSTLREISKPSANRSEQDISSSGCRKFQEAS